MEQLIHSSESFTPRAKYTFSGFLHQHELSERLCFIKNRILNGYSQEEMSFLLGRTTQFIKDYEELGPVHVDSRDLANCDYLFKLFVKSKLVFDDKVNKIDISYARRLLKGLKTSTESEIYYQFTHPWLIGAVNKPIVITERVMLTQEDPAALELFRRRMLANVTDGYLNVSRAPVEIYKMLVENSPTLARESICWLKRLLYQMVHAGLIHVTNDNGRIYFIHLSRTSSLSNSSIAKEHIGDRERGTV